MTTERSHSWSGKPTELYYRLMTPKWLADNATWDCTFTQEDLVLKVNPDSRDYERVFYVQLLDKEILTSRSDVTVKIRVGLDYTGTAAKPDPISFTVSDGSYAFGFQLQDVTKYNTAGPYYPIEGTAGHLTFQRTLNIQQDKALPTNDRQWPRVFEMRLKPTEGFGICYTALNAGHMISATFQGLDPSRKGLLLEVYRGDDKEHYDIRFVEVTVTSTHK